MAEQEKKQKASKILKVMPAGERKMINLCGLFLKEITNKTKEGREFQKLILCGSTDPKLGDQRTFFVNFYSTGTALAEKDYEGNLVDNFLWRVDKDGKDFAYGKDADGNQYWIYQLDPNFKKGGSDDSGAGEQEEAPAAKPAAKAPARKGYGQFKQRG
jgi:hypothetical protein